jgi:wyosine [tRNA(Phe)-imidazoG37] synthetase (radical SAM superfamily)
MEFRYVYGPVPSRRLGRSLGVNPIPFKTCNYSCVYCQLGRTSPLINHRQRFFPPGEILEEIQHALKLHVGEIDHVTFVGEGEPTLYQDLGDLIAQVKKMTPLPVAVITNGSLLHRNDVRQELVPSDVVIPSLDAADPETWKKVNRPHGRLNLEEIIEGMVRFRHMFHGQLWVEVMLVKGINDQEESLLAIRRALDRIAPDEIHLNIPIRPPAEGWVEPADAEGLVRAHVLLGEDALIDTPEEGAFSTAGFDQPLDAVTTIVRRHPMRYDQIVETLDHFPPEAVQAALDELIAVGKMRVVVYRDKAYYVAGAGYYAEKT